MIEYLLGINKSKLALLLKKSSGFRVIWFIEASLIRMVHMPFSSTQFVVVLEIFVQSLLD